MSCADWPLVRYAAGTNADTGASVDAIDAEDYSDAALDDGASPDARTQAAAGPPAVPAAAAAAAKAAAAAFQMHALFVDGAVLSQRGAAVVTVPQQAAPASPSSSLPAAASWSPAAPRWSAATAPGARCCGA